MKAACLCYLTTILIKGNIAVDCLVLALFRALPFSIHVSKRYLLIIVLDKDCIEYTK